MSNTRYIPERTISVRRFCIRLLVKKPWPINDQEIMDKQDFREVVERAMILVARASYMVNGPNREVFWSIEWLSSPHHWETVMQGRSRIKDRPIRGTPLTDGSKGRAPGSLG
jgi:hypothetical protein